MNNRINVWRLMLFHQPEKYEQMLQWVRENNRVAIGWGNIGDMSTQHFHTGTEISAAIRKAYPKIQNFRDGGSSLWKFKHEIQPGDLIILKTRRAKEVVARVHYEHGAYCFDKVNTFGDYFHQRRVELTAISPEKLWAVAGNVSEGQSKRYTLFKFANSLSEDEILTMQI